MNATNLASANSERITTPMNGWGMLVLNLIVLLSGIGSMILILVGLTQHTNGVALWQLAPAVFFEFVGLILLGGHFTLQPNEARVLILFGSYRGTVRASGFWWANPFYARYRLRAATTVGPGGNEAGKIRDITTQMGRALSAKLSLRARNFISDKLKVNDKRGNPVEIAAVVVWRIEDTAKASFDVDDYESYVHIQSEAAIRHIASLYPYDRGDDHEPSLRESAEEVATALKGELHERLAKSGVAVEEARLTHLAYAPEIAQAMLRRQQAEAIISARQKIVQGAVSMVEMALKELSDKGVVRLDEERKAAMVSNLLVVLCGETEATPVINTGTLYN